LAEWKAELGPGDQYDPRDRPPRAFDRKGSARHAMDKGRNLHEMEEEKFLKRLAARIGEAEKQGAFDHLVIAAPPRALGLLREYLPAPVLARVRAETAKDVLDETQPQLRARLGALLRA
jgi:protein required for attachment to host cells